MPVVSIRRPTILTPTLILAKKTTTKNSRGREWKAVERSRTPFYLSMQRLVTRRFSAERDAVAQRAGSMPTSEMALTAALLAIEEQQAEWVALLRRIYRAVSDPFARGWYGRLTGKKAVAEPLEVDVWQAEVDAYIAQRAPATFVKIAETSTSFIRAYIADAVSEGASVDQIARTIREGYSVINRRRARVIARTETISASNAGGRAGALATGLTLRRVWISTMDDRTRDAHLIADGQSVPMDVPYALNGGDRLMFPGDTSLGASAANIVQCRCTEAYIPQ